MSEIKEENLIFLLFGTKISLNFKSAVRKLVYFSICLQSTSRGRWTSFLEFHLSGFAFSVLFRKVRLFRPLLWCFSRIANIQFFPRLFVDKSEESFKNKNIVDGHLKNSKRVRSRIRSQRSGKSDSGISNQFLRGSVRRWNLFLKRVVRHEPGIVADKSSAHCSHASMVKSCWRFCNWSVKVIKSDIEKQIYLSDARAWVHLCPQLASSFWACRSASEKRASKRQQRKRRQFWRSLEDRQGLGDCSLLSAFLHLQLFLGFKIFDKDVFWVIFDIFTNFEYIFEFFDYFLSVFRIFWLFLLFMAFFDKFWP